MPKDKPTSDLLKSELKIEQWDIDRLIPYCRNPRKNDAVVDKMVSAIKEFGFRIPIVAKSDGSVIDGHLRLKAAQKLGMKEVPVALADELTDAQVKAFRLLANRSVDWAEWDNVLLKLELQELQEVNFDLELTGFDLDDLENIIGDDAAQDNDEDSNPTLADRYMFPPFSVLSARDGDWQNRKNEWIDMGIQSELGREGELIKFSETCKIKRHGVGI